MGFVLSKHFIIAVNDVDAKKSERAVSGTQSGSAFVIIDMKNLIQTL